MWDYALRVLANRAHASAELRRKLASRAQIPSDVTAVMARLREYQLADDKKFAELFASSRLANEGFGKFRVLRDLRAKQVTTAVAEKAVAETFADTDETQLAASYLERKYRGKNLAEFLKEEKNLASAFRRLRTAGFSAGVALAVLKSHSGRAIDLEAEPDEDED